VAGRAPIRRYNTTSARTLALHLASQDNPESGLCPSLRPPKGPPAALNSLTITPISKPCMRDDRVSTSSPKSHSRSVSPKASASNAILSTSSCSHIETQEATGPQIRQDFPQGIAISERPVSKDHRSFAANVFGTVAFKMLEWLTPAAIDDMSRRVRAIQGDRKSDESSRVSRTEQSSKTGNEQQKQRQTLQAALPGSQGHATRDQAGTGTGRAELDSQGVKESPPSSQPQPQQQLEGHPSSRTASQRRNSNAKVRTSSGPRPKRQLSIDPYLQDTSADDTFAGLLKSPRTTNGSADKTSRNPKATGSSLSRPISQLSSAGFFDDVSLEKMPAPKALELKSRGARGQPDSGKISESSSPRDSASAKRTSSDRFGSNGSDDAVGQEVESDDENILPQTLSRLNPEVIDFICDIIQEDGTAEKHVFEPPTIARFHNWPTGKGKVLRRKRRPGRIYDPDLKLEWKLFVEQSLFYVLSDPHLLLKSFTKKGQLYDSQTLWYCMLRMTRIMPSVVFHSLWLAASSLFAPPKALQSLRSPTTKLFPKNEPALSNQDAGRLLSICFHALIAAAPLVQDSRIIQDMSRIRSQGLAVAAGRQPVELCLQYEDAFTDSLALRLARRLFAAITARRDFNELITSNSESDEPEDQQDVLAPLFSQLDFLNVDAVYVLDFSVPDRAVHETRVPVLLLEWARTVMINEWNGSPEVPGNGPFGGALALIDAMCKLSQGYAGRCPKANNCIDKRRHDLLLADGQFLSEYFAERLDTVHMPVAWLGHESTRHKLHLLDFPYIFRDSSLVSYFRSINFSRMNQSHEEASAWHRKLEFIAPRSGLGQHHKEEITERLSSAASKYLILQIRRNHVIEDAFDQLWRREERELLRPLKVHLGEADGEEGFDSGGVQQEFFRLAIAEALNPDYGAFTVDERTRMTWFVPGSMVDEWKFELVGLLVSLAVYNGLTLPVTFPRALYRKLLGEPVTELHHIADGWPDLASGLTALLEWDEKDGLVEDVFARTYEFSVSVMGQHITREMKPPGRDDEWPQFPKTAHQSSSRPAPHEGNPPEDSTPLVTAANRNAYVSDYIRYLTDVSVRPQFEAFARGFRTCLHPKSLSLLTPSLLQSLVEGVQEIDISELRRYARYVGWDASHRTVRDFWSIVKKYDNNMKRKLLEFVTASDRLPVGGIKNLMFVVQRNGEENDPAGRLPTSYTCYGTLLLPEYKDKEMLRERLAMALENAQGFGFA